MTQPREIQQHHLLRRAVVYIRQSSPEQVRTNTGSAAVQRDLVDKVAAWGWPTTMIDVMDGDLGVSGARPGARDDFNSLLERMGANEIGIVAVVDASRLSRNIVDLLSFVHRAQQNHVLLAQGDQLIDFTDPNSGFIGGVLGLNAIRETQTRLHLSVRARRKKALAGVAPTGPPVGYVRLLDGSWTKDPDPQVREVVRLVFDKFIELGSLRKVVRYLRDNAIQIPRRRRRNQPLWTEATYTSITGLVTNPVYAGQYIFGRTKQEPPAEGSRKRGRQRPQPADQWVVIDDHHEPYVDLGQWQKAQERIRSNRIETRPAAGRGEALLQGLLRCPVHNRGFHTVYNDRLSGPDGAAIRRLPRYLCLPVRDLGDNRVHCSIQAGALDTQLEHVLFEVLAPVAVDGIQQALRQELRQHEGLQRVRQDELRRAAERAEEAERAFFAADRAWPHLTQRLSQRFDQALADLEGLRTAHRLQPLVPPISPDPETLGELRRVLGDLPTLWRHPTVTAEQRKTLLRAVVTTVYATRDAQGDWTLEVVWEGGARTMLPPTRIPRRKPSYRVRRRWGSPIPRELYQRIRDRVVAGHSMQAIADDLNAIRAPRSRGRAWSKTRVISAASRLRKGVVPDVAPLPPIESWTAKIRQLHKAGHSLAAIVEQLNDEGLHTRSGTPFTADTVRATIVRLGLQSHFAAQEERLRGLLLEWSPVLLPTEIAVRLNERGLTTQQGSPWTPHNVCEKQHNLRIPSRRLRSVKAVTPPRSRGAELSPSQPDRVRPTA